MAKTIPTMPPRADTTSGIPSEHLYRLPKGFLCAMRTWPLDRDALRLLHVLLYRTCRDCQDWWLGTYPQPDEGLSETFRAVHDWQGTHPGKGNGAIRHAMAQLLATGAFEWIEAQHRNRVLCWRFTEESYEALFANDRFGCLDARVLPHLRDAMALTLLGEVALVRKMRRPGLRLDVEDLHRVGGLQGMACWKTVRRPFLSGLATIGAFHGLRVVLGLAWHHRLAGTDTLHVRLEHAGTTWKTDALGKSDHRVGEVIVIDQRGVLRMSPDALPACLKGRRRMPV